MGTWTQLTTLENEGAWSPGWTPDGVGVVFYVEFRQAVRCVNTDGSGLTYLMDGSNVMPRAIGILEGGK